ncbi:MAG: aldehyde dehydrogenase family protein [Candidatus Gracilibacteria bacterium]
MKKIQSINPYNGELNAEFELFSDEIIEEKINTAHEAFLNWKNTSFAERKKMFYKLVDVIDSNIEEYAKLQTIEMGMLYAASLNGLKGTSKLIKWFADNAENILAEQSFDENGSKGKYIYDPLGVIFGVGPWNFPYNQILRAAVPNIIAGNTTVYKHASNVPMCAAQIEKFFRDAGFPEGIYTNMFVSSSKSEYILSNRKIRGVNLTGGELAGKSIGSLAGKYLKPSVLELGGNDAFVLLDHADTKKMVAAATACRIGNGGQKCNSSKRFIILDKHYDVFVEEMGKYMKNQKMGDPMNPSTQIPPLAKHDLVDKIHSQVQKTISEGARLIVGGKIIDKDSNFYPPTVLADVKKGMTSYDQETFGPVASIIKSSNIEESIKIANESELGLSAVVYGDNIEQCRSVASKLEGGMIFINAPAGSQPHLPFGGVKNSGYGKENGPEGLRAFTNKKVIVY